MLVITWLEYVSNVEDKITTRKYILTVRWRYVNVLGYHEGKKNKRNYSKLIQDFVWIDARTRRKMVMVDA